MTTNGPESKKPRREAGASWQPLYDGLLNAIIRHRLNPGDKLVEEEIAEFFGVSRTVVRAALQALARDGVVVLQRNKGASVARPTPDEAREIFQARALIEPAIAALAAGNMTPERVAALHAAIEAEHSALHEDRPLDAVFHSADFHRLIADYAGQKVLADIVRDLLSQSSLVIALYWRQPEGICDNHAHLELIDALARGEGARSGELMRVHVEHLLISLDLTVPPAAASGLAEALRLP
ncbi:GntR family transcriptional regulator [Pseudoxanthobacter sp.]|uniref:GntR family transcriptional regulator n=1 Tax=Pseudoxanthobacter sp. TaxID=1925742 RepID=UPI002FE28AE8